MQEEGRTGLDNADLFKPGFDEGGPFGYGFVGGLYAKAVSASGKKMDVARNSGVVKRTRIEGAVASVVDRIVPRLQEKGRRGLLRHGNVRKNTWGRPAKGTQPSATPYSNIRSLKARRSKAADAAFIV